VLFGPTVEAFGFAPRMRESRAFSLLLGCRPCSKHGKVACRYGDRLCFVGLPEAEVAAHLAQRMGVAPPRDDDPTREATPRGRPVTPLAPGHDGLARP
jgi:hypothetical protein